jgi:hypothetical protein
VPLETIKDYFCSVDAPGQIWTEHLTDFSQVTIYAFSMFAFGNDS